MKKTVIILIGIIFIASILLVTFFGLVTEEPPTDFVSVKSITIIGEGVAEGAGEKHIILETPLTSDAPLVYQIECLISPDDATNKTVIYEIEDTYATVSDSGLVTITGFTESNNYNTVTVKVYAVDNEGSKNTAVSDIINIWYLSK